MPSRRCIACQQLFQFQGTGKSRCPRCRKTKARGYAGTAWTNIDRSGRCGDPVMPGASYPAIGCGKYGNKKNPITVHHVVPKDRGGSDHPSNLMLLCKSCNSTLGTT